MILHLSTLLRVRRAKLTEEEREFGLDSESLLQDRDDAVKILVSAFAEGRCPAEAFAEYRIGTDYKRTGLDFVKSAKRICDVPPPSADSKDRALVEIMEEHRLWSVLEVQVEQITLKRMMDSLIQAAIDQVGDKAVIPDGWPEVPKNVHPPIEFDVIKSRGWRTEIIRIGDSIIQETTS